MDDDIDDLEKEVICLRELLSHLKLEESALIQGVTAPMFRDEQNKLQKERLILQRRRKALLLEKTLLDNAPEVITYLEQINSLIEKISEQRKINLELRKGALYPLQKMETKRKIKKKNLMLEDA